MIDNDSQNPPFARGKSIQDLPGALVNQQRRKKGGARETEQINRESNLAGRFHRDKFGRAKQDAPTWRVNSPVYRDRVLASLRDLDLRCNLLR